MSKAKTTQINAATVIAVALMGMLGGCGGGGDSPPDVTTPTAPVVTTPVYDPSTIGGTTPVASTYAALSEELAAFNLLNAQRSACGFGSLNQSTQLDTAALGHANWQLLNNFGGHYQEKYFSSGPSTGLPTVGFTGVSPFDRVVAAGYPHAGNWGIWDEIFTIVGSANKAGVGTRGIRGLLTAPYHLAGLVSQATEIGFAVRSAAPVGADIVISSTWAQRVILQVNLGYQPASPAQLVASDTVLTYPCQDTAGTNVALRNESPNPVPDRDLALNPVGQPIYIQARIGNTLTISSASMILTGTGAVVALRTPMTSVNDPNALLASHQAFVIPDASLLANTQYQVIIYGTNNGTAFTRTFTFTTGS